MRQLWSRMTWGLTLACALALCAGSAQAINTNPYEQYPIRTTIGIVALVLAIVLALFTILRSWIKAGIRRRSYGEDMRYGTPMPSHKMARKSRKRYGKDLRLPIHFTNYRGRKKQPASVGIPVPAELHRHRKITGRKSRYGSKLVAVSTQRYTGGASRATSARFVHTDPLSHKGSRRSQRRFGVPSLPVKQAAYKGGGSVAKPARFESTMPLSHRGRAKASKYYGGKLHAKPVTSYKGGGSVAKPARFESTLPLSHRGRAKVSKYYGGKMFAKPVNAYKGGESVAKPAKFGLAAPKVHHGNKAEKRLYGGRLAIEDYNRYKGKRRNVPGEDPVIRIRVERGRANIKRYGGKIQFTSQANYEGNQPIVRIPDSYAKRGKVTPGKPPVVPLPDRSYKGGNRVRTEGEPEVQQREPHRKMVGKPEQYGIKKFPGNPPSYKGK